MTVNCKIQRAHFFPDQYEDLGLVSLEQAIRVFNEFPWEEEMEIIRNRDVSSTKPCIRFETGNDSALNIRLVSSDRFDIEYCEGNHFGNTFVSRVFGKDHHGYQVEDFIALFFDDEMSQILRLDYADPAFAPKASSGNAVYYSIRPIRYDQLLWIFPLFLHGLFFWVTLLLFKQEAFPLEGIALLGLIQMVLMFLWIPGLAILFTYWKHSRYMKVGILPASKAAVVQEPGRITRFLREDIAQCLIARPIKSRNHYVGFSHIRFILKDGKRITITSFLEDPYTIADLLQLHYEERTFFQPFLMR